MEHSHFSRRVVSPPSPYDRWFAVIVIAIVSLGLLMTASASISISDTSLHQPFYFFYRQLIFLILGIIVGGMVLYLDTSIWEKIGVPLLGIILALLVLVLIPGIGHAVNGSSRWIKLGFISVQVSELAKWVTIIYLAGYLVRRQAELRSQLSGFLKPMGLLTVMAALLLKEPDFGSAAVLMVTAMGMMFLGGMRLKYFLGLGLVVLAALVVLAISEPYRLHRLTSFLNPWANPFGSGYQLIQSLIAFGRGGWFGMGLGNSIQKLSYLPESHTDFLFAVIAEELGVVGVLVVIVLFTALVLKMIVIGREAQLLKAHFRGFLAYGFGIWFAIQFCVSLGVNTGILPTKGLTLPLMSYGGSSLIINCVAIALIFRIDYENRMQQLGLRE